MQPTAEADAGTDGRAAPVARLRFADMAVGRCAAVEQVLTAEDTRRFAELSGDVSPLHVDAAFARSRGYARCVVHGAHLAALVSRLVGVHLPGEAALLQSLSLQFKRPVLVGSRVRVTGVVDQLSEAVGAAVLRITVADADDGRTVAAGKATVGFTAETDHGRA